MAKNIILKISEKGAKKTAGALKKVGGAVTFIGKASGLATAGIATLSTKLAGDFQKSLLEVSTLMDSKTSPSLKTMSKELRSVASSSGLALSSISKAKYDIVSAGFSNAADSALVLEASSRLAVGGVTSAAEAADLLTTALNAYGKDAEDVNSVSDTLFTTVRLGKTTMGELAGSLGRVLPFAKSANLSLDDVGAAMATLTASGINTAEATTSLTSAITALTAPSDQAKQAMQLAGIEVKKFDDGTVDLVKTIEQFQGLDQETVKRFIPNIRAIAGIQTMANNFKTLKDNVDEFSEESAGATEEAFKKMEGAFNTQMSMLKNNFQSIMIEIGDVIIEKSSGSVKKANEILQELGDIGWDVIGQTIADNMDVLMSVVGNTFTHISNAVDAQIKIMALKVKRELRSLLPDVFGAVADMDAQIKILEESAAFATENSMAQIKKSLSTSFTFIKDQAQQRADAEAEIEETRLAKAIEVQEKIKEVLETGSSEQVDIKEAVAEKIFTMEDLARQKNNLAIQEEIKQLKLAGVSKVEIAKWEAEQIENFERNKRAARASSVSSLVGALGQANTAFKGSALVSKSLAQAQALIDTYAGANKALASSPPPFNFIAASAVVAAGLANVATIESQQFASGGIVQGAGNRDTVPAMLTPGELILNKSQQDNLAGGMGGVTVNVSAPLVDETVMDAILPAIEKAQKMSLA